MEAIGSNVNVLPQKPTNGKKAMKHVANAALATAGIGATAVGTLALARNNYYAAVNEEKSLKGLSESVSKFGITGKLQKGIKSFNKAIYNAMSFLGNKMFPAGGKWENALIDFAKGREGSVSKQLLKGYKANVATLALGVIATIGIIAASSYKAAKVNAEGK